MKTPKTAGEPKAEVVARSTPPYIGFARFNNLLDRLHDIGTPIRIERNVMGGIMNGSDYSHLLSALRYLGLVNEQRLTSPALKRLADATGDARKKQIRELLESAYPFVFSQEAKFDLTIATTPLLHQKFVEAGTTPNVANKCITFFLNAASYADMPISQHIRVPKQSIVRTHASRATRKQKSNEKSTRVRAHDNPPEDEMPDAPIAPKLTGEQMLMRDVIAQLDKIPDDWTLEQRERWATHLTEMLRVVRGEKTQDTREATGDGKQ